MENTFDINAFDKERLQSPASFKQCQGLGYKFAKDPKTGSMNWRLQKQIQGCLYGLAKEQRLTFKKANELFTKKVLPKAYFDKIDLYLKENS
jgi:hypothetical protein